MAMKKTPTKTSTTAGGAVHPDHPGGSVTTTDHEAIKAWAEARGGRPAAVEGTGGGDDVGIIRLEFPGAANANDAKLDEVDWAPFFEKFDASGLALVYQEQTAAGEQSNFNRFVKRETAAATSAKRPTAKKTTTAKKAVKKGPVAKTTTTAKKTTPTAKKAAPAAKKTAAKKAPPATAKKATAKKAPAAKKTAAKKTTTAKKVPAARGYRGR